MKALDEVTLTLVYEYAVERHNFKYRHTVSAYPGTPLVITTRVGRVLKHRLARIDSDKQPSLFKLILFLKCGQINKLECLSLACIFSLVSETIFQ